MTTFRSPMPSPRRHIAHGFSLIELLVSVVIGLVVILAVFTVLANSEGRKRTSTSVNDVNQSGAYAVYTLDRAIRNAGTGYTEGWGDVFGCGLSATLRATDGVTAIGSWPRATALPAPFAGVPLTLSMAPVVIFDGASGAGSDVVMVMSGTAGFGEAPLEASPGAISATQVSLPNTIGYRANDLLMLAGNGTCVLTQVASTKTACAGDPTAATTTTDCGPLLPLGGRYHDNTNGNFAALAANGAHAFSIGNATTNPPQFMLYGVGADNTLFSQDLLAINGTNAPQAVAEGVSALHAVYGLDLAGGAAGTGDGRPDTWVPATGAYAASTLLNGTPASNTLLRQIVAVRVALVMRSSLVERPIEVAAGTEVAVAPASLALFASLPAAAQTTVNLTAAEQNQRHRTIELTVPVRNLMMPL